MKYSITIFILLLMISCGTVHLKGKKLTGSSEYRKMEISFINDTLCKIQQEFYCNNLPDSLRHSVIFATYKVYDTIFDAYSNTREWKPIKVKARVIIFNRLDSESKSQQIHKMLCKISSNGNQQNDTLNYFYLSNFVNDTIALSIEKKYKEDYYWELTLNKIK